MELVVNTYGKNIHAGVIHRKKVVGKGNGYKDNRR